jgi:hypothetical protein
LSPRCTLSLGLVTVRLGTLVELPADVELAVAAVVVGAAGNVVVPPAVTAGMVVVTEGGKVDAGGLVEPLPDLVGLLEHAARPRATPPQRRSNTKRRHIPRTLTRCGTSDVATGE